jgi:WD40 repeat protein
MAREEGVLRLGPPQRVLEGADASRVALSPTGRVALIQGLRPSTLLLLDPGREPHVQRLGEVNWRGDVNVSSDGRYVAAYSDDSGSMIWDLQTGRLAGTLPARGVWSAFSPNSRQLFTSDAHELCQWEVGTWTRLRCISAAVDRIALSSDGRLLAARSGMTRIKLLQADSLEEVATLEPPGLAPHSFAFSPDGTLLAAFMTRNLATCIWDLRQIRARLAELGLDWDLPPYPAPEAAMATPLRMEIDRGHQVPDPNPLGSPPAP